MCIEFAPYLHQKGGLKCCQKTVPALKCNIVWLSREEFKLKKFSFYANNP